MSFVATKSISGFRRLRWFYAGLLLLASVLNYVDRQALSILAPTIQRELHISDIRYGYVVQVFLICYAVMYFLSGRIVDAISTRFAEATFLAWWSIAGALTALITGFRSLLLVRSLLGLAEPGNYTASAKVVSEWFPPHERGTAVGLYSMGGTLGAAIAAPLIAYLAIAHGWRSAFVTTGLAGMVLALAWLLLYRSPDGYGFLLQNSSVENETTRSLSIAAGQSEPTPKATTKMLTSKAFWAIVWTRMATDPVWYFYLFWFPKYLQEVRGMSLASIGRLLWIIFVAADAGSFVGGIAASRRIRRGSAAVDTRVLIMAFAAIVPCLTFVIPMLPGYALPVAAACCAAFAHMAWMTNATTLPLDIFPSTEIGSIQGMIGGLSSAAAFVSTGFIAFSVSHFSYRPVFIVASFLYPLALMVLFQLPKIYKKERVPQNEEDFRTI